MMLKCDNHNNIIWLDGCYTCINCERGCIDYTRYPYCESPDPDHPDDEEKACIDCEHLSYCNDITEIITTSFQFYKNQFKSILSKALCISILIDPSTPNWLKKRTKNIYRLMITKPLLFPVPIPTFFHTPQIPRSTSK